VQAPHKCDLQGDFSYQYTWVPMLQAASGCTPGGLPGRGADWLAAINGLIPGLVDRGRAMGFNFVSGPAPAAQRQGPHPPPPWNGPAS